MAIGSFAFQYYNYFKSSRVIDELKNNDRHIPLKMENKELEYSVSGPLKGTVKSIRLNMWHSEYCLFLML